MAILNLTQHTATDEQISSGVVEPANKPLLCECMTFETLPGQGILAARAKTIADFAAHSGHRSALIGGAPFFMPYLEQALWGAGVRPLYAFSERVSEERTEPDGSVRKVNTFRHRGFVGMEFCELPSKP